MKLYGTEEGRRAGADTITAAGPDPAVATYRRLFIASSIVATSGQSNRNQAKQDQRTGILSLTAAVVGAKLLGGGLHWVARQLLAA